MPCCASMASTPRAPASWPWSATLSIKSCSTRPSTRARNRRKVSVRRAVASFLGLEFSFRIVVTLIRTVCRVGAEVRCHGFGPAVCRVRSSPKGRYRQPGRAEAAQFASVISRTKREPAGNKPTRTEQVVKKRGIKVLAQQNINASCLGISTSKCTNFCLTFAFNHF